MKCSLIQEILDTKKIMDQFDSLEDILGRHNNSPYYVKDWFKDRPALLKTLKIKHLSYPNINHHLNQIMANLF